jgi:hypothetical protein
VLLKPTTFKNDQVLMSAFSPGGYSLVSDKDFLSAAMAAGIMRVVAMSHPKTARGMGIFSVAYIHFVLSLYAAGSFYIAGRSDVGLVYGVAAAVAAAPAPVVAPPTVVAPAPAVTQPVPATPAPIVVPPP